jgi:3-dehydroquinate dehydratase type I
MICIPIVAGTHTGALRAVDRSAPAADVLELRMDLIPGGNLVELVNHARACKQDIAILVTHRRRPEVDLSQERQRIAVLRDAVEMGVDYVDVELETEGALREKLLSAIQRLHNRTRLIVSHHDFNGTPAERSLRGLFHRCMNTGADMVKIVTWSGRPEDNLAVLKLIPYAHARKMNITAFCMGPLGRISRVAAPLLGSCLDYVAFQKSAESASGQLTVAEMRKIRRILGEKN